MNKQPHRLFLVFLVLALAVAPLRSALAVVPAATPDSTAAPCAQMQHDMQSMDHLAGMHGTADETPHQCDRDCNGSCCDGACSVGMQSPSAITGAMVILKNIDGTLLNATPPNAFPDRPFSPLFRPPVDLLS